ncbi:MAG: hybrid sensor histidine kinase/response regulator, partial [Elusimicrobiota bacterium]|nr:hybrid sensor histidine kinase/response regulator [Elusimicrobiota bacterium]
MEQQTQKDGFRLPEKKKMEALGRLSCKVAHDFNNILGAIEGYATLALNGVKADDPLAQDLREIRAAVAKAAALGKQLIVF